MHILFGFIQFFPYIMLCGAGNEQPFPLHIHFVLKPITSDMSLICDLVIFLDHLQIGLMLAHFKQMSRDLGILIELLRSDWKPSISIRFGMK